ncbi:MAG: TonB-dependent receptor [Treponema sp.]|jgi:vitamin B12 transporter|nr:TonB-dependent receptor [Treponema sp.]
MLISLRGYRNFLFTLLILAAFFPLYADENSQYEFDDEIPFMEDEGITIVGTPETTQHMRIISREEIDQVHAPDVPALLEQLLHSSSTRYGPYGNQADINIRGFDTERIAVLIDGVPVNSPMSGDFDFSMINIDAVEKIEVIYGGSDTKYNVSGALGGIVNIITIKKQKTGWRAGGTVSNTSTLPGKYYNGAGLKEGPRWMDLLDAQRLNLSAGFGTEKFSGSAAWFGTRAANHYLINNFHGITRRKEHNEVWDSGTSASFIWDLPGYAKFIASGGAYYGSKNFPLTAVAGIFGNQRDFSLRQNFMLDMPRIFRDDLAAEFSIGGTWQTLNYKASEDLFHLMNAFQAVSRWSWFPLDRLTLRTGGDYRYSYLDSDNAGRRGRHDGGIYFTVEVKPVKKFLIISSVKMILNGAEAVPVPKLGFLWTPNDSLTIKNNYFRSFKFPDFDDLYWVQGEYRGNPDLKPEDGWGADLTAAYLFGNYFNVESTVFIQETDNSIHWNSFTKRPENAAQAVFFGWDSKIGFEIPVPFGPVKKIIPSLSYKFLLSYILAGTTGDRMGFSSNIRIPYMPVHTAGLSLEIPWEKGSLLVSGRYESLRYAGYTAAGNTGALDPHFILNVSLNRKINKNLSAFAVLRNALNRQYESFAEYPMPGITAVLGLRMNLGND